MKNKQTFKCLGWKDSILTFQLGKNDTIEITGTEEYNSWEKARLNGGDFKVLDTSKICHILSVYEFLLNN